MRMGCCGSVCVRCECPGGGRVVWSHGADGRSLLLLARLSLCVRFSPGASRVRNCALCASPRAARRLGFHASGQHCASGLLLRGALWDWLAGAGGVSRAGLWIC